MHKTQVCKWLKDNKQSFIHLYGLEDWTIRITVKKYSDIETYAQTWADYHQKDADIEFFAENIPNMAALKDTFRHELCHVVAAAANVYEDLIHKAYDKKHKVMKTELITNISESLCHAIEKVSKRHRGVK